MIRFLCPKCKTVSNVTSLRATEYTVEFSDNDYKIVFEGQPKAYTKCSSCNTVFEESIDYFLVDVAISDSKEVESVKPIGKYWETRKLPRKINVAKDLK